MSFSRFLILFVLIAFTQPLFAHSISGGTRRINKTATLHHTNLSWTYLWTQKVETSDGAFLQVAVDLEVTMSECRGSRQSHCKVRRGRKINQIRPDAVFRLVVNYPHPTRANAYASVSIDKPVKSVIRQGDGPFKRDWIETLHFQVNIPHVTDGEAIVRILGKQNDSRYGDDHRVHIKNMSTFMIP